MSIEILNYKEMKKSALEGYVSIYVPKMGLEIYEVAVMNKNGQRWINLPQKKYEDRDTGETKYSSLVRFREREHSDRFRDAVLQALDNHLRDSDFDEQPPF